MHVETKKESECHQSFAVEHFLLKQTPENYLGEGGYGSVYKGYNRDRPSEQVAIKTIPSEKFKTQELQLIKRIRSEYLVRILLICSKQELTYIVMELCDGDLGGHLAKFLKLDSAGVTLLAENLARGYQVLETHKIVHRDIKPQNILIKYDRQQQQKLPKMGANENVKNIQVAKLSDFGTSRLLTRDQSELCNVAGTLFYMAPEVGANLVATNNYDHSADMWSVGCVLYESLTGQVPFDEAALCKLFLNVACKNQFFNHSFFNKLSTPAQNLFNGQFEYVISSLLNVDPKGRMTPQKFFDQAVGDLRRRKQPFSKLNVKHRLSAIGREENRHSKSFTYILSNKDANENRTSPSKVRAKSERRSYDGCIPYA